MNICTTRISATAGKRFRVPALGIFVIFFSSQQYGQQFTRTAQIRERNRIISPVAPGKTTLEIRVTDYTHPGTRAERDGGCAA